jgi:hypothetical protein
MSTTILHANLQRSRFTQHVLAALGSLLRSPLKLVQAPIARTPAEQAAVEAQRVRSMALAYAKSDPGFSADLYAAAARHEGLTAD